MCPRARSPEAGLREIPVWSFRLGATSPFGPFKAINVRRLMRSERHGPSESECPMADAPNRRPGSNEQLGVFLAVGVGVGVAVGLALGGGSGLALGIALGAGAGLGIGSVYQRNRRE